MAIRSGVPASSERESTALGEASSWEVPASQLSISVRRSPGREPYRWPRNRVQSSAMKALSALLVLAAVALGCANSSHLSKAAYEAKVQATGTQLLKDYRSAFASVLARGGSDNIVALLGRKQAEKIAHQAQAAYDRAASKLDALDPPREATADNDKIASGLRAWGKYQGERVLVSPSRSRALGRRLSRTRAYRDLFAAIHDLQRKGYKLGVLTDRFFVGS